MSQSPVRKLVQNSLSSEQLRDIIQKAIWAPSGDNCQPWTFEYHDNILFIYHDHQKAKHPLNHDGIASMLSMGTLLESVRLACTDYGYQVSVQLLPFNTEAKSCWAKLSFQQKAMIVHPLSAVLLHRTTDRRLFRGGQLLAQKINCALTSRDLHLVKFHWTREISPELIKFIVRVERLMIDHPCILHKVLEWTRFSEKQINDSRDGLSHVNLGVKFYEIPLLLLFRKFPKMISLFRPMIRGQHCSRVKAQLKSSAGLICVSAPSNSSEAIVQGGSLMMRAWLELNQNQFGVQPFTLASMLVYLAAQGKFEANISDPWRHVLREGEKILRESFSIPQGFVPLWMIRTGASTELPENARTLRHSIDDVLKVRQNK